MTGTTANRSAKLKLVLLAALFLLPVVLSVTLFTLDWRPGKTTNYGELIQPARALSDTPLRTAEGKPFSWSARAQKWALVYVARAHCTAACLSTLQQMRQVHLAQGRESNRAERLLIADDNEALRAVAAQYPEVTLVTGTPEVLKPVRARFAEDDAGLDTVFIIDPMNNVMMRYRPDADPSGMRKDLKHLLKLSKTE